MPGLAGRRFDRVPFLQSFGYANDPVRTLQSARGLVADDGFILLTRTQPIRYAIERAEANGTSLGEEYFSNRAFSYNSGWNEEIALTKRRYTMSDLINAFSAAMLWIETAVEPQLSDAARRRYPHKHAWMNKYLGSLIFKLRPHDCKWPSRGCRTPARITRVHLRLLVHQERLGDALRRRRFEEESHGHISGYSDHVRIGPDGAEDVIGSFRLAGFPPDLRG